METTENKETENKSPNFWENCVQKTKTEIIDLLISRLGEPKNELDNNCLDAVVRKIVYFYGESKDFRGQSVSSMIGKVIEISQKEFKEGKRRGKTYYQVKLDNNIKLRVAKDDLSPEKWTQIEKLVILEQKLVFKYRKWIVHKDIVDFYPVEDIQETPLEHSQKTPITTENQAQSAIKEQAESLPKQTDISKS